MRNKQSLRQIIHPKLLKILSTHKKRDVVRPYFNILVNELYKHKIYYTVDFDYC